MKSWRSLMIICVLLLVGAACQDPSGEGSPTEGDLVGLFTVLPGSCSDAGVSQGSYFRMIQPGGKVGEGPFVTNGDSPCGDKTWTALSPGTDGGLRTGEFQPNPDSPFDDKGNATAAAVAEPQKWFAVAFALSTNPKDPQTEIEVTAPRLRLEAGKLTGDLRALGAAWNGQFFNQGAPKPDGSLPGGTSLPTGTFDPDTSRYSLDWSSQIVGGPFNNFIGVWHLEGVFEEARR